MTTRRRFFSIMGAAPLAAKGAADEVAKGLAGLSRGCGLPTVDVRGALFGHDTVPQGSHNSIGNAAPTDWQLAKKLRDELLRGALNSTANRAELESILYQDHRYIYRLDHDLAANRSMSLAAKITFQRQRMVQASIKHAVLEESPHQQLNSWKDRILSIAGIKFG